MQAAKMTYEFDIDSVLDKFRAVLDEAGLIPGEIVPDGRLRRCGTTTHPKSTNGWQVLHSNPFAGAYGDWATGISDTWGMDGQTISSADRERLREEIHRQRQKREAAHLLKIQLAATKARKYLSGIHPATGLNSYLERKGFDPCPGLLADGDLLVVPVLDPDHGQIISFQRIAPDGSKRFMADGHTACGYFAIRCDDGPLVICEGIATGLSIYMATGRTVLVAFSPRNRVTVAQMARERYPDRPIIIAGDNDTDTESKTGANPGVKAATEAASAVNGLVAIPEQSCTLDKYKAPLSRCETEQVVEMAPKIQAIRSERLTRGKAILTLRAKAGNPKNDINEIIRQVQDLEDSLPEIPIPPRLFVDDITPEGLVEFMGQQGGRAAILEAEGGIFELISGLYTNDKANLNVWLKAWSCEKISVDRKSKDTIHIDKPALSMVLLPQPDVLRVIGNKDGFRGRGLLGGFLYCLPQSRLGQRLIETPPIPARSLSAYESKLLEIVESPWATDENGNETHHVIRLSQDAYKRWVTFADSVEAELGDGGELFNMTGWAGKLPGQAIRHKPFVTPG